MASVMSAKAGRRPGPRRSCCLDAEATTNLVEVAQQPFTARSRRRGGRCRSRCCAVRGDGAPTGRRSRLAPLAATVSTIGGRQPPNRRQGVSSSIGIRRVAPGLAGAGAVGLVDDEQVGDLQQARPCWPGWSHPIPGLTTTTVVSVAAATSTSCWPTPTVSTMNHRHPHCREHLDRVGHGHRQAAEVAPGGHRPDEHPVVEGVALHADRSPRTAPPEKGDQDRRPGRPPHRRWRLPPSVASSRLWTRATAISPSVRVDFAGPGAPVIRNARPDRGRCRPPRTPPVRLHPRVHQNSSWARATRLPLRASSNSVRGRSRGRRAWSDERRREERSPQARGDVGSRARPVSVQILVAAVHVVGVGDHGLPFGHQSGQHQGGTGPESKARTGAAGHTLDPPDERVMALGADVGAHAAELLDVAEPAEEQVFGHDAHALGHGEQRHQQRLVVGGKSRIGQGGHVHRLQPVGRVPWPPATRRGPG